jgi:hypothetical protein
MFLLIVGRATPARQPRTQRATDSSAERDAQRDIVERDSERGPNADAEGNPDSHIEAGIGGVAWFLFHDCFSLSAAGVNQAGVIIDL